MMIFVCGLFPYPYRFWIAKTWARSMLFMGKALCGLDYVFEGLENIPDEASVIQDCFLSASPG